MYEFEKVDVTRLNATKTAWMKFAADHSSVVSVSFYEGCFATCHGHIEVTISIGENASAIYGVFVRDGDKTIAAALVSVMHARPKGPDAWLKVLSVYVEPSLNVADQEPDLNKLAWIAATAILGALDLTYEAMPSNELKVWANVPMTKTFLTSVSTVLFKDAHDKFDVSSHGNWLVVKKNDFR
jgi:hypothetical protein